MFYNTNNTNNPNNPNNPKVVDKLDSLQLIHCNAGETYYKGIITASRSTDENTDREIILTNFPQSIEYILSRDSDKIEKEKFFKQSQKVYKMFSFEEGTLVRVFNYENKWYISTQSRLDIYKSGWSNSYSFGEQWENFLQETYHKTMTEFLEKLDTTKRYIFLLPTIENNRIGKKYNRNEPKVIYFLGYDNNDQFTFFDEYEGEEVSYFHRLRSIDTTTIDETINTNLLIYVFDRDNKTISNIHTYKLVTKEYHGLCKFRNNESDLELKYLRIMLKNPQQKDMFMSMFPNIDTRNISITYYALVEYLHTKYFERYIKHKFIILPKPIHYVLKKCHEKYLTIKEKTTKASISELIKELDDKSLFYLYKEFTLILNDS